MNNLSKALVEVEEGKLQGTVEDGVKVFRGVPYAAAPVGERRFRVPEDHEKWKGIRDASRYGGSAIQNTSLIEAGIIPAASQFEEDCLYLNIWTKAETGEEKKPVFIWVHGGGMVAGSGSESVCNGELLCKRKDIIVVTINYRLGFFGFFGHPELRTENAEGIGGNYAFWDMRKAIIWVKNNIAAFGGNPDNITVAGQSGGAIGCGVLLASPMMKGLFQHICIESGPLYWGMMSILSREEMENNSIELMRKAGCSSIDELRRRDAWELYQLAAEEGAMKFNYFVDGVFIPYEIHDMYEQGDFNDVDVIIGNTSQEMIVTGENVTVSEYQEYITKAFPGEEKEMEKWYPATNNAEVRKAAATIMSDIMLMGAVRIGQLCKKYGRKAYVYLVTKATENEEGRSLGSAHCAEMPYLFGRINTGGRNPFVYYEWQKEDYQFMDTIMGYWSNFARSGNPNEEGLTEWPIYSDYQVMILGNETKLIDQKFAEEIYPYYLERLMEHKCTNPLHMNLYLTKR